MAVLKIKEVVTKTTWHVILCSNCAEESPYQYKDPKSQKAQRWKSKDWYCERCREKVDAKAGPKPLCECGHRKYRHYKRKGKCEAHWFDESGYQTCDCEGYQSSG